MIIVKLHGGLGNQMFQYTFIEYLRENFPDVEVKADITRYSYNRYLEHQGLELEYVFRGIELHPVEKKEILLQGGAFEREKDGIADVLKRRITMIWSAFWKEVPLPYRRVYNDETWGEYVRKYEVKKDSKLYLYGYWNKCEYRNVFQFSDELIEFRSDTLEKIIQSESVSLHIRRGDYVGTSFDCVKNEYYTKAISYMEKHLNHPYFFVFSDDIGYAEKMFETKNNIMIVRENQGKNSYRDMYFMSMCKHNIICNSTFSYWGARLNKNENKKVILPKTYCQTIPGNESGEWIGISI